MISCQHLLQQLFAALRHLDTVKMKKGKQTAPAEEKEEKKLSNHAQRKVDERKKDAKVDPLLESQFAAGRLYAVISSRPG